MWIIQGQRNKFLLGQTFSCKAASTLCIWKIEARPGHGLADLAYSGVPDLCLILLKLDGQLPMPTKLLQPWNLSKHLKKSGPETCKL